MQLWRSAMQRIRLFLIAICPALTVGACAAAPVGPAGASPGQAASAFFVTPLAEQRVGTLPEGPLYWTIETFPTAEAATAARSRWSLYAVVNGRHWLFTLGRPGPPTPGATRVAQIGPVAAPPATTWLLRINHAGGPPGARTRVHTHPGSEAIYVLRGEVTQHTAHGTERAGAGAALNAHAPEMVMQLASSGGADLEQLVMFVVDADRPFSPAAHFPRQ
jgi:hypothetical protein